MEAQANRALELGHIVVIKIAFCLTVVLVLSRELG